MFVKVDKGEKVKVKEILITGNKDVASGKIKKSMKNTKTKNPIRFWKGSKYIKDKYKVYAEIGTI